MFITYNIWLDARFEPFNYKHIQSIFIYKNQLSCINFENGPTKLYRYIYFVFFRLTMKKFKIQKAPFIHSPTDTMQCLAETFQKAEIKNTY